MTGTVENDFSNEARGHSILSVATTENASEGEKKQRKIKEGRSVWKNWSSRKDMQVLMDTGTIGKGKKSRKHFEDDTLCDTVRYILRSNNIQLLSWGTRRLHVDETDSDVNLQQW